MSRIFYDHLLDLSKVDKTIKKVSSSCDEKIELWQVVDEIIHHRVVSCLLDNLPKKYHQEFLELFCDSPGDEKLLAYLKEKVGRDIKLLINEIAAVLVLEIVGGVKSGKVSISKNVG